MVTHMKTTVDIADELLRKAKLRAAKDRRTLKSLLEEGLRLVLADRGKPHTKRVEPVVVNGKTPAEAFSSASMRATIEHDEDERLRRSGTA